MDAITETICRGRKMKYIIAITYNQHTYYVAEGRNYTINGSKYVPITVFVSKAKRYKTRKIAEKASKRSGENMWGRIEIVEVEE